MSGKDVHIMYYKHQPAGSEQVERGDAAVNTNVAPDFNGDLMWMMLMKFVAPQLSHSEFCTADFDQK